MVLVSPSGTESWLAEAHADSADDIDWTYSTVHNWDESSTLLNTIFFFL